MASTEQYTLIACPYCGGRGDIRSWGPFAMAKGCEDCGGTGRVEFPATFEQHTGWNVLRHGGRSRDLWRVLFTGTEAEARNRFEQTASEGQLRQGGVRLYHGALLVQGAWAPRLRTRW